MSFVRPPFLLMRMSVTGLFHRHVIEPGGILIAKTEKERAE